MAHKIWCTLASSSRDCAASCSLEHLAVLYATDAVVLRVLQAQVADDDDHEGCPSRAQQTFEVGALGEK
jgi:hypothetical protein